MDAKGRTPAKSGRLASADSMLCLEMWSCAPAPSTLRMVVWASLSVAARTTRTSASAPALVLSANWNGAHARWNSVLSCCASVRATRRRNASPITSARTSPDDFERATILPRRRAGRITPGTCAIASLRAAPRRSSAQCSSSRRTRKCSPVQPDGPGAAPFLERRTLAMRRTELSSIAPNRPKPNSGLMGMGFGRPPDRVAQLSEGVLVCGSQREGGERFGCGRELAKMGVCGGALRSLLQVGLCLALRALPSSPLRGRGGRRSGPRGFLQQLAPMPALEGPFPSSQFFGRDTLFAGRAVQEHPRR